MIGAEQEAPDELLRPVRVDDATGYRLYRTDQAAEARLVGLLRSLDLPLDQVRTAGAAEQSAIILVSST